MKSKKLLLNSSIILIVSLLIQFLLIIYKHFIGYVVIRDTGHFFRMLSVGTILTMIVMSLILPVNFRVIRFLDKYLDWKKSVSKRLFIELFSAFLIGALFGLLFTMISELLFGYKEPLGEVLLSNLFIAAVINLIGMSVIEAIIYFRNYRDAQSKAEILERENLNMRFNLLKKQLDPHFLFNSLNILSSLIHKDNKKSQEFIDAFSSVYRYTLDVIEKPVVRVSDEIEFARSYLFLQKLRFEDAFSFNITTCEACLNHFLPPLALQILLENAFKHNTATPEHPLNILVTCTDDGRYLRISNNIQEKSRLHGGHGVGLENLRNRYRLISDKLPEILRDEGKFTIILPLIEAE